MIHLLLDAARMQSAMATAKELNKNYRSLYKGRSEAVLADFAPYLFQFTAENQFNDWFWEKGWGDSWGMILKSSAPGKEVYHHFRKFLLIYNDEGQQVYFRFYDPRVLRAFLPTCDSKQLQEFFGPIRYFLMEDINPESGTYYWLNKGELKTKTFTHQEIRQNFLMQ